MGFVPCVALPVTVLLVDEESAKYPQTQKAPTIKVSINGAPFKQVAFPVTEVGDGWYRLTIPSQYVGGHDDIIVCAQAEGTAEWRDIINEVPFQTEGGNVFVPEPLPDVHEPEPEPEPEPPTDGELGPELLTDAWLWRDRSSGGSIRQKSPSRVEVVLGQTDEYMQYMQLMQVMAIDAGRYQVTAEYAGSAPDVALTFIQHGAPYAKIGDPLPLLVANGGAALAAEIELRAEPSARLRITVPRSASPGSDEVFSGLSLRRMI